MTLAAAAMLAARPATTNLFLASAVGLLLAHFHAWRGFPPSNRLAPLRPLALAYVLFLIPVYGAALVAGGYLVIATLLRLLDGSHYRDARGTLLLSLVTVALGLMQHQSALILVYLAAWLYAAEAFALGALASRPGVTLAAARVDEPSPAALAGPVGAPRSRRPQDLPLIAAVRGRLPGAIVAALLLFLVIPRISLGIFLLRGGPPAYTGGAIGLGDLEELRQSNDVVMRVRLSRRTNVYFRGRSFNIYSPGSRRWLSMPIRQRRSSAAGGGTPLPPFGRPAWDAADDANDIGQEFWLSAPLGGAFFAVYAPVSTDYPSPGFTTDDLENHRPVRPVAGPLHYTVASRIPPPAPPGLRELMAPPAGPMILAYLQVPTQLPDLKRLAWRVVGDRTTVLDRALAIENHLRNTYAYTLDLTAYGTPSDHRDPIEAFLFDHREGHCELFASAMVLMCRTVGVPARLTEGFAGGEYVEGDDYQIVRGKDAHAWVEVYFHGFGWYTFDPTGFRAASTGGTDALSAAGRLFDRLDFLFEQYVNCYGGAPLRDLLDRAGRRALDLARRLRDNRPAGPARVWLWRGLLAATALALLLRLLAGRGWFGRLPLLAALRRRLIARAPAFRAGAGYGPDDFYPFLVDEWAARGLAKPPHLTPREFAGRLDGKAGADRAALNRLAALHGAVAYGGRTLEPGEREEGWATAERALERPAWTPAGGRDPDAGGSR